jgi:hypothetical protein
MASGCCSLVGIIVLLVGSAELFRAAVSLSNKCFGVGSTGQDDANDEELDEWIGYRQIKRQAERIPNPGIVKAVLCTLAIFVLNFLSCCTMSLIFGFKVFHHGPYEKGVFFIPYLFGLVMGSPFCAWILARILPTIFWRAALVLLIDYLLVIVIIGIPIAILSAIL